MTIQFVWAKLFKKIQGKALRSSLIHPSSKIEGGCNLINVKMGKNSFCGYNCEFNNVEIGSFCSIASNVIIGGNMHPLEWVSTSSIFYEGRDSIKEKISSHKFQTSKRTVVGHDVWIGQNVMIKQGVKIGTGAVIGMGAVVTKDVAPYEIVAGVPAKTIKKRFNEETINILLNSEWWFFSDEKLRELGPYFNNVTEFIKALKQ